MPPLKGIDRGLDGKVLKILEESGHGEQVVIVDPSYAIPEGARVVDYHGDSSAQALRGILALVPSEATKQGFDVVSMDADPDDSSLSPNALNAFKEVVASLGLRLGYEPRLPSWPVETSTDETEAGFYANANDPEKSIFVRTRDPRAYACARFIVGHSQE